MIEAADLARFTAKLESLPIARHKLHVFGRARLNVHVICKSRATAQKWAQALASIDPGRPITCTATRIERAQFKADAQNQRSTSGWLVAL